MELTVFKYFAKIELIEQMKDNAPAFGIKKELIAILYALLLAQNPRFRNRKDMG